MVFINPHYMIQGLAFEAYADGDDSSDTSILFESIIQKFQSMFEIVYERGLLRVARIISDKITTKELCLEDICINKGQLQDLLNQSNLQSPIPSPSSTPEPSATPLPSEMPSPTPEPSISPVPSETPTPTSEPSASLTPSPTPESQPTPTI